MTNLIAGITSSRSSPFLAFPLLLALAISAAAQSSRPSLPTIRWDSATVRLIQPQGDYGRMARLRDGSIACVYDCEHKMWIRHSSDEAKSWQEPILVAEDADCWLTNADLLPLQNGALLYFWNERPLLAAKHLGRKAPPGLLTRHFLIRMARSTDQGHSWSKPQTLYTAGTSYDDGCWEPAGIQLPSGEIQVYFSNEARFTDTAEQEIALLRSKDGGQTWSKAETASLRKNYRDGMPAPLVLANGRGMVFGIEDNGYAGERFKPVIVHTSMADNWRSGAVAGDSPRRWGALAEPLDPTWYGGAPFLRKLPSGETLLSYQEGSSGSMRGCRMAVCVGDPDARNFTNKTYPLPTGSRGSQTWSSLFVKDAQTVIAVSSATINGTRGIWAVDGRIMR